MSICTNFSLEEKVSTIPKPKKYGVPAQEDEIFNELHVTGSAEQTTLDDLKHKKDKACGYLFDFGNDWWHQIKVVAIEEKTPKGRYPKITNRVGQSPPQYMDIDK